MICHRIGLFPMVTIGFGLNSVSSFNRYPIPPQRMTVFMWMYYIQGRLKSKAIKRKTMLSPPYTLVVIPANTLCHPREGGDPVYNVSMSDTSYCVYIMSSKKNGTLYIGVTDNMVRRVYEHKNNIVEGFTKRYNVHLLVYYEIHNNPESAIEREKLLKKWNRQWKLRLIEESNPTWSDLYEDLLK